MTHLLTSCPLATAADKSPLPSNAYLPRPLVIEAATRTRKPPIESMWRMKSTCSNMPSSDTISLEPLGHAVGFVSSRLMKGLKPGLPTTRNSKEQRHSAAGSNQLRPKLFKVEVFDSDKARESSAHINLRTGRA